MINTKPSDVARVNTIFLTGGGTGGSVSPLLAVHDEFRGDSRFEFVWLGTYGGPEKDMVERAGIKFHPIASGKLRRYFSWQNFSDIFFIFFGGLQALYYLLRYKPAAILTAGGFVSVPVVIVGRLLGIKAAVHQQDVRPGLANKLMAPFAAKVTVTFVESAKDYGDKAEAIGNPIRKDFDRLPRVYEARDNFGLGHNLPTLLIIGGGTGAAFLNQLVQESLSELIKFSQIIHITGKGKDLGYVSDIQNYKHYDFLDVEQMRNAYAAADIIVTRCGLGVLTELSYIGKPSVMIPIPNSHQEDNAMVFFQQKAALVLDQNEIVAPEFIKHLRRLLANKELTESMARNIKQVIAKGANQRLKNIILKFIE